MSQDEKPIEISPEPQISNENSLEIIPESKKEDSPDRLPVQQQPEPIKKEISPKKVDSNDQNSARVLAASELPLKAEPVPSKENIKIQEDYNENQNINNPQTIEIQNSEKIPILPPTYTPNAKKEAKSAKNLKSGSKRPSSKSSQKSSTKITNKEPAKESLYDKVLKEFKMTSKKGSPKQIGTKSGRQSEMHSVSNIGIGLGLDSSQRDLFLQLRESLLQQQKKDAVTRQTIEKLQKEKRLLEEEKAKKENMISKCEKTRVNDGVTIAKQEEIIAKLRIDQQANIECIFDRGNRKL